MAIENQGYIRNLNLQETTNASLAIANLAGPSIPQDLKLFQNNLRNTSILGYSTFSGGFFRFNDLEFIFTNNDRIEVSENVSIGSTSLNVNTTYFVCNSNGKDRFKISTTSQSVGFTTFDATSINNSNFNFIRDDSVSFDNIVNAIDPNSQLDSVASGITNNDNNTAILNRAIFGSATNVLKNSIEITQTNIEIANFLISQKYSTTGNVNTDLDLKYEGVLKSEDPVSLNSTSDNLTDQNSPGFFISNIRAFSNENNPWSEESGALKTFSSEVSINELFFYDQLQITGISAVPSSPTNPNTFTHKIPIKVDGEIYYILLKSST